MRCQCSEDLEADLEPTLLGPRRSESVQAVLILTLGHEMNVIEFDGRVSDGNSTVHPIRASPRYRPIRDPIHPPGNRLGTAVARPGRRLGMQADSEDPVSLTRRRSPSRLGSCCGAGRLHRRGDGDSQPVTVYLKTRDVTRIILIFRVQYCHYQTPRRCLRTYAAPFTRLKREFEF
jgi:hypothetical protein